MRQRKMLLIYPFNAAKLSELGAVVEAMLKAGRSQAALRTYSCPRVSHADPPCGLINLLKSFRPDIAILLLSSAHPSECRPILNAADGLPRRPALLAVLREAESRQIGDLLRMGIADFMLPPLRQTDVLARVERCLRSQPPGDSLVKDLQLTVGLQPIIGRSARFREVLGKIPLIARCDASVLISGETGTGKELCARAVHYASPRSTKPFVPVNCGALPIELVENELFGHKRMAFTGANESAPGLVEEAQGGSLFLDEIDGLPQAAQVKLLRLLQEKEYRRLGSTRTRNADIRVIAATNLPLDIALEKRRIRRDLYYRLSTVPLRLPPLRKRREDIPELARHFLAKHAVELKRRVPELARDAERRLYLYDWPGNVRELENVIERLLVLNCSGQIRAADIDVPYPDSADSSSQHESFREAKARVVAQFERDYIQGLLLECRGNISRAARRADKNRRAFFELIRKHGIQVERFRATRPQQS